MKGVLSIFEPFWVCLALKFSKCASRANKIVLGKYSGTLKNIAVYELKSVKEVLKKFIPKRCKPLNVDTGLNP
jgi:hypothetical protein